MRLALILLASSLYGQNAVYKDYSPLVKGIVIGDKQCSFWFHSSVYPSAFNAGWDYEVACYDGINNVILEFKKAGSILDSGYTLSNGFIRFIIVANTTDPTKYDISLGAKGPDDQTEIPEIKLTI